MIDLEHALAQVIDAIDTELGEGYAKKNPDMVASMVNSLIWGAAIGDVIAAIQGSAE